MSASAIPAAQPLFDLDEATDASALPSGVTRDSVVRLAGGTALRFEMVDGDPVEWQHRPIECDPGRLYQLAADTRALLLRTVGLRFFIRWIRDDGGLTEEVETDWIGSSSDWTRRQLVARAPNDASFAAVGCRLMKATRWGGQPDDEERIAWVDGVAWGETPEVTIVGPSDGNVIAAGDDAHFEVSTPADGPPTAIMAELVDVWERTLVRRNWSPDSSRAGHLFDFGELAPGYYEIEWRIEAPEGLLPRTEVSSMVVLRPGTPCRPRDAIAVDGALSWAYKDSARLSAAVSVVSRPGIPCIRDRFSWMHVSPERQAFDPSRYQLAADLQTDAGMQVFSIFQFTPLWASHSPSGERRRIARRRMPRDPYDAYLAMREAASHFREKIDYWEIWNEADLPSYFIGRPDEYAAFFKAASLGAKAGNQDAAILTCSFTGLAPEWARRVIENGALDYADIYNLHYYGRPWRMADGIEQHRKLMRDTGRLLPMWMSENGERSSADVHGSRIRGETDVSQYLVQAAATALAEGIDRYFYFAFPPIWERAAGPWGLVRDDLTPMPAYATLAALREIIGEGRFLGDVDLGPGDAEGYLFDPGTGRAALIVVPKSETYLRVPGATAETRPVDIVGNDQSMPWSVDTDGVLHVWTTDRPMFVTELDASRLQPRARPGWPRFDPDSVANADPGQVFAWIDVHGAERDLDPRGIKEALTAVIVPPGGEPLPFRIVVYNTSQQHADVTLTLDAEDGITLVGDGSATMSVPPGGRAEYSGAIGTDGMVAGREYRLRATGGYNGGTVSPVVVHFRLADE